MDRKIAALAKKLKALRERRDRLEDQVGDLRNREEDVEGQYVDSIAVEMEQLLKALDWQWPGKSGRREVSAVIPSDHRIVKLLEPVRRLYRYTLRDGLGYQCTQNRGYATTNRGHAVRMSPRDAARFGLKRPGAPRKAWSDMKRKLEKAGITDEAKLAELLKATGGE